MDYVLSKVCEHTLMDQIQFELSAHIEDNQLFIILIPVME